MVFQPEFNRKCRIRTAPQHPKCRMLPLHHILYKFYLFLTYILYNKFFKKSTNIYYNSIFQSSNSSASQCASS